MTTNKVAADRKAVKMHFAVLGPLSVSAHESSIDIGGRRQRRLLAALLANSGKVVSTDRLIDIVFEGDAPDGAATTIRSYVARLRKSLADSSSDGGPITTRAPGYTFEGGGHTVDADEFEETARRGHQQLGERDPVGAIATLTEALSHWRGAAYEEFIYEDWSRSEAARLEELRISASEDLIEARLDCGLHDEAIHDLLTLTHEHPVRERFRTQLVLALYRSGRQVEALRAAEAYREELIEVGLEPSSDFLALERGVAAHDPALHLAVPAGKPLRGYRLGAVIGEGAHGVVYEGVQPGTARDVAIKALRPELVNDPGFIRRFDSEALVISRLEHPHIAPLYDYWREPGGAYMVMRRLDRSLDQDLATGPLDIDRVANMAAHLGSALALAHQAGVVHGDVKPGNVLCDRDGNFYVSDFGVATLLDEDADTTQSPRSAYRAPETYSGEEPTKASDQYTLAILLVRALTGTLPFGSDGTSTPHDRVPSTHTLRSSVPVAVDRVLERATSWDPGSRFVSIDEFTTRFVGALTGSEPVAETRVEANPYKGLQPFLETDAEQFFGRDKVIRQVLDRLDEASTFLTLVGASGCGKSSIVRAGVIPRLRSGAISGSESWLIASLTPGADPFAALHAAIRPIAVLEPDVPAAGNPNAAWVRHTLEAALPQDAEILLFIDQFEEIFTAVEDGPTRDAFIDGLIDAVEAPQLNLRVLCTLRADFYDRPLRYGRLAELMSDGTVTVVGMSASELDRAIREPAALAGVEVAPALAADLVASVADEPSSLPLLQFTLAELFEHRRGRVLTLDSYQEMGGVETAISEHAERVFARVPQADRAAVRRVFLRMITLSEEGSATRRRLIRSDLSDDSSSSTDRVIDVFGDGRLLTFDRDPATREPTVEIAHEAMIQHWPRLRRWVSEAGEGLLIQGRLAEAARVWDAQGRDPGDLMRGARLETTEGWASENATSLTPIESEYLTASVALRDTEIASELAHREQQQRSNKRLRRQLAGLAVTLAIAVVAGFLAVNQRNAANEAAELATVGELAAHSKAQLDLDPQLALLLALEAVDKAQSNNLYLPEAEESLHWAVMAQRQLVSAHNWTNGLAHFSPDGVHFIALTHPASDLIAQIWSVETLQPVLDLVGHEGAVIDAVFSGDGSIVATTSFDGTARIWDATSGAQIGEPIEVPDPLIPALSRDGTKLAVSTDSPNTYVFDLEDPGHPTIMAAAGEYGFNLEFSPDGTLLATCHWSQFARLWDVNTGELVALLDHQGDVGDVGFTPDGTRVLTGGADGTVKIWDVATHDLIGVFDKHEGGVRDFQISADGSLVASGGTSKVLIWDLDSLVVVDRIIGHSGDVDGIDLSPDNRYLVTGSWTDETTRLWDLSDHAQRELATLPGVTVPWGVVDWSPDGSHIAATMGEKEVTVWDPFTSSIVATTELPDHAFSVAYDTEGSRIAIGGWLGVSTWDPVTGDIVDLTGSPALAVDSIPGRDAWAIAGDRFYASLGSGAQPGPDEFDSYVVAPSPDGSLVAVSVDRDPTLNPNSFGVEIYDTTTGAQVAALPLGVGVVDGAHNRPVYGMTFTPDGSRLVTVSEDATGAVWDTATWEPVVRLEGHDAVIVDVDADPTRNEVATASRDGTVKIWDLATGRTRLTFPGGPYTDVSYSPDGRYLAAAQETGLVRVFYLDLEDLVAAGRARLTRDLSATECVQFLDPEECA